jgi:hypothetical protein
MSIKERKKKDNRKAVFTIQQEYTFKAKIYSKIKEFGQQYTNC